jgi:RND family efflux transporter MFP subunit
VQTKIAGWVEQLFVNFTGQRVQAGDPILSIYSPDLVATQEEYLLALQASRAGGSDGSAKDKRMLLESARSRLRFWDLTLAQIRDLEASGQPHRTVTLHSPIGGYVTLKPVSQGMYVTPEMELYTVTELGTVWVWADIYEDEISLVRPGQSATISLASEPGTARPAVISYVNPTLEPTTRTLRVRFDVENADGQLKPGMYAMVELEAPLGDVLALPEDAVIDTGERKVVFVALDEGRFQPREVRIGRKAQGYYEVLDGLVPDERVVVSAQFLLDSESRLRAAAGGPAHGGH